MDNNEWGVSWNPGTFGQLLRCAIGIQIFNVDIDLNSTKDDSHYGIMKPEQVLALHPHNDRNIPEGVKVIKPYFETRHLSYFPKYLHYIKWFKSFPDEDTLHDYYDVKNPGNFHKVLLQIYWNAQDSVSEKCFNIKMDDFFDNFDLFVKNFEDFLGQRIKTNTSDFLKNKRRNNLKHFEHFNKKVVDSVDCVGRQQPKDIDSLHDYEKLLILSTYVQGNWDLTSRFLRKYNNGKLTNTMDIYNIIHADN
jgi:hypothetical protein